MAPTWSGATRPDVREPPTHLADLQQERNSKSPKDLLVEMCNWNQHLVLLIQVHLVQRDFLTGKGEISKGTLGFSQPPQNNENSSDIYGFIFQGDE